MQGKIFVNYRRQTDSGIAGRIYDSLNLALPNASIFMDVDKLNPGDDFEDALEKTLAGCVVFLAIIGPQWATMLNKRVRVIPVLVGGAAMPDVGVLPEDLKALTKHQAMEIRHERFRADVDALAQVIAATAPGARAWRWRRAAIAAVAAFGIVTVAGFLYVEPIPIIHGNSPV